MIRKEKNGLAWLEFELFQQFPDLCHGVFLKKGGVSSGLFSSLNFGFSTDDSQENILNNLSRALGCLNLEAWRRGRFNHGDQLIALEDHPRDPEFSFDGLVTQGKGVGLVITHADCQAIILYDPVTKTLANVHSGWRGSVKNILQNAVYMMQERFFAKPENIFAGIAPSLGPEDAEFINYRIELPSHFWPYQNKTNYFDFWEISRMQLQQAGLKPEHIEIAGLSNFQHTEDFFSRRRNGACGRNATIAALK